MNKNDLVVRFAVGLLVSWYAGGGWPAAAAEWNQGPLRTVSQSPELVVGPAVGGGWSSGFGIGGFDDWAVAMEVWDDDSGPALYVAGNFTAADGKVVNRIAKWDLGRWVPLDSVHGTGMEAQINDLIVFDDGRGPALYAAGCFRTAGGVVVNHIARWCGTHWAPLVGSGGSGTDDEVIALAVYDDGQGRALFAGGRFVTAGGKTVNGIARWDGNEWSALSTGTNGRVCCLQVYNDGDGDKLYVGGYFTMAGGRVVHCIASWDGTWKTFGGPDNGVLALEVFDDGSGEALYLGGDFRRAGGITVNHIARWDGSSWSSLSGPSSPGTSRRVTSLEAWNDGGGEALYVSGPFRMASGVIVNQTARWDGSAWSVLAGPSGNGVGPDHDQYVADWLAFDDGTGEKLWAAGGFTIAGGLAASRIAKWDGRAWSRVTSPVLGGIDGRSVDVLQVHDDGTTQVLCAGGDFDTASGVVVNNIACWNGQAWSALSGRLGTGIDGWVRDMVTHDDGSGVALYAAGQFYDAGGVPVQGIARWDGYQWSSPHQLLDGDVRRDHATVESLLVWDDGKGPALYAGGYLSFVEDRHCADPYNDVQGVARWNGRRWTALPGLYVYDYMDSISSMAVYDDGSGEALYAAGGAALYTECSNTGDLFFLAKWDGSTWEKIDFPRVFNDAGPIFDLAVYDDGTGSALYVAGLMRVVGTGDSEYGNILRFKAGKWSLLAGPDGAVTNGITALAVHDGKLFAGGSFEQAGGVTANGVAAWDGSSWSAVGSPPAVGTDGGVRALASYDDALWVGGRFHTAGGVASLRIGRWISPTLHQPR